MKKYVAIFCIVCAGLLGAVNVNGQAKTSFSGLWVLDREKTGTPRDFPEKLKDYRMLIGEDQDRLMVKAQVVGPVEVRAKGGQDNQGTIVKNAGNDRSTGSSYGVSATTMGSTSVSTPVNYGGTMALYFTPPDITYDLTGKEIKIEPNAGDRVNGTTKIKAKLGKDGKSIELVTIRKMKGPRGEVEVTSRESWKVSDDGQSLKFHRTVETPTYRDEIDMVMAKQGEQRAS